MICPLPSRAGAVLLLAHGGGGRLTDELVERIFLPTFASAPLAARHDGAVLEIGGARIAFTTDAHVVHPLFFPGGDIGSLAVNGTVNDLAMCGARPLWLSCALIAEEGLALETLERVARSMQAAAQAAGVAIATGDTKVVERGAADGLFVCTSGIGLVEHALCVEPASVRPGDAILVSGDVGRHGVALLSAREGLRFEGELASDTAPLAAPVAALLAAGLELHCLRDLTRGGLANALVEIARAARVRVVLREQAVPVGEVVRGACELLGLDPLYVANEGRFACFLPADQAPRALAVLRAQPGCEQAALVGAVAAEPAASAALVTALGTTRRLELFDGETLPRIC